MNVNKNIKTNPDNQPASDRKALVAFLKYEERMDVFEDQSIAAGVMDILLKLVESTVVEFNRSTSYDHLGQCVADFIKINENLYAAKCIQCSEWQRVTHEPYGTHYFDNRRELFVFVNEHDSSLTCAGVCNIFPASCIRPDENEFEHEIDDMGKWFREMN